MGRLINFLSLLLLRILFVRLVNFQKAKTIRNQCENLHKNLCFSKKMNLPSPLFYQPHGYNQTFQYLSISKNFQFKLIWIGKCFRRLMNQSTGRVREREREKTVKTMERFASADRWNARKRSGTRRFKNGAELRKNWIMKNLFPSSTIESFVRSREVVNENAMRKCT